MFLIMRSIRIVKKGAPSIAIPAIKLGSSSDNNPNAEENCGRPRSERDDYDVNEVDVGIETLKVWLCRPKQRISMEEFLHVRTIVSMIRDTIG
jgi:hypothetical protein